MNLTLQTMMRTVWSCTEKPVGYLTITNTCCLGVWFEWGELFLNTALRLTVLIYICVCVKCNSILLWQMAHIVWFVFSCSGLWNDINCGYPQPYICERHNSSINATAFPTTPSIPGGCPDSWLLFENQVQWWFFMFASGSGKPRL